MRWRARSAAVAAVVAVFGLAGCAPQDTVNAGPHFVTAPLVYLTTVLWPPPLAIVGLTPGTRIELRSTVNQAATLWAASAFYTVPASGQIDLAAARPQLSPFDAPDSAGLVWSLRGPALTETAAADLWTRSMVDVHVAAYDDGRRIASTVLTLAGLGTMTKQRPVLWSELSGTDPPAGLAPDDRAGTFYPPVAPQTDRSPVVVVFDDDYVGASEAFVAPLLALFGAAVFVIPIERDADRIHFRSTVTAASVQGVLEWLATQPNVDARHIFTYGSSQSEQLALWAAGRFPSRIFGAFAAGGSTALLCRAGEPHPSAFDNQAPVPCAAGKSAVDDDAVVSLAGLRGPVVLGCVPRDEVLASACSWQDAAFRVRGVHPGDVAIRADGAAHAITVPPGLPLDLPSPPAAQATEKARVAFWNAVARILLRTARS